MIKYLGKALLIKEEKEKILVIGDIHLGIGVGKGSGIIEDSLYETLIDDLKKVFDKTGKVDYIVLLGDIKHGFSRGDLRERSDVIGLLDFLEGKSKRIVIIKGNHDNYVESLKGGREKVEVKEYWIWKKYCFLHGDKDFVENYDEKVGVWVMGHLHPAIVLRDKIKSEKYKCFLTGKYKNKEVVILPSFISSSEGTDIRTSESNLVWEFNFKEFEVRVVEESSVLNFGKLKKIN